MPTLSIYRALRSIALHEFADVVLRAEIVFAPTGDALKLRLEIVDDSFLDIYLSASGRYSYHRDRRLTSGGDLYRHDNAPHQRWRGVGTYPKHFHQGNEGKVVDSHISDDPEAAIREFLAFVHHKLLGRT